MSPPRIVQGPVDPSLWHMAEEIFFLSAAIRDFDGAEQERAFLERWTGYYRECEPQRIFLAVSPDGFVAGYLTGCLDSRTAERLYHDIPYYPLFADQFGDFPAHLHVNVHPLWRGRKIGSSLVNAFVEHCEAARVAGVHVVTAVGLRNVGFYQALGFASAVQRPWQDKHLQFLGKSLHHS